MGFAATANLVTRTETTRKVGPFNAYLQSGGDDDWGHRLRDAGGVMVYSAEAVIDHPARSSWRELSVKTVRVAEGMAALARDNSLRDDLRYLYGEARFAVATLVKVWGRDWPESRKAKLSYAITLAWVCALRCLVRIRCRVSSRKA